VGVGDVAADTRFISGVDPQPIATGFALDVDPSFVEPEFMSEYEAAFGDKRADGSVDDQPIDRQLMPLAFAIMEKENNGSWG
jgi:hypothetical protein